MLTILNSESLWIGTDMIQFNAIRDILDREKIKYKYKTYNHLGEWAGSGTLRGNFGSVGNPTSQSIQYEIFVARKDLEKAQAVIMKKEKILYITKVICSAILFMV